MVVKRPKYKALVHLAREAYITPANVAFILQDELYRLLGGEHRYIEDGLIYEVDYHEDRAIRRATTNEIEVYEALKTLISHFKNLEIE
jgi:hypothetical protein